MNLPKIELNGKPVSPRELTLREIEAVLQNLDSGVTHSLESMVPDEPVPAMAVALSIAPSPLVTNEGAKQEEIDKNLDALLDLSPSQARELVVQVRDKNPSLARVVEDLATLAGKLLLEDPLAKDGPPDQTSPEPSTASDAQPAA